MKLKARQLIEQEADSREKRTDFIAALRALERAKPVEKQQLKKAVLHAFYA